MSKVEIDWMTVREETSCMNLPVLFVRRSRRVRRLKDCREEQFMWVSMGGPSLNVLENTGMMLKPGLRTAICGNTGIIAMVILALCKSSKSKWCLHLETHLLDKWQSQ